MTMTITINGKSSEAADAETVASVVDRMGRGHRGIAVAVNGNIVPRSTWEHTALQDGDSIEVLTAAQGG